MASAMKIHRVSQVKERRPPGSAGRMLLTLDEAAELLAVSKRTVYSMLARGELADCYPTPGAHRIFQDSILAHLDRRTTPDR
jgi:excisionase family DNA binding protein